MAASIAFVTLILGLLLGIIFTLTGLKALQGLKRKGRVEVIGWNVATGTKTIHWVRPEGELVTFTPKGMDEISSVVRGAGSATYGNHRSFLVDSSTGEQIFLRPGKEPARLPGSTIAKVVKGKLIEQAASLASGTKDKIPTWAWAIIGIASFALIITIVSYISGSAGDQQIIQAIAQTAQTATSTTGPGGQ